MNEQRTLCYRCANDYRDAGYILKSIAYQAHKQECFKCNRMGWTYLIERKRDGKDGYKPT